MHEEPLDREKLREIRRARNKEKRKLKQLEKSHINKPIKTINTVTIVSPEFLNKYKNQTPAATSSTINLLDIVNKKSELKPTKLNENEAKYIGNRLDSSQPVRVTGKHRENPKKSISLLKRKLINLHLTNPSNSIEYKEVITDELKVLVKEFISKIVELQEKLYKRDPIKGDLKRRYVTGFREVRKYLVVNKITFVVIAIDLKIYEDDPLHKIIKEIVELSKSNNIPYTFVLKRRQLGYMLLKQVPISCMGVLNYDGANEIYNKIKELKLEEPTTESSEETIEAKYNDFAAILKDSLIN